MNSNIFRICFLATILLLIGHNFSYRCKTKSRIKARILLVLGLLTIYSLQDSKASVYDQSLIDAAAAENLLNYGDDLQNAPMPQANAIYLMALVVHQNPDASYGPSNLPVRNRLLEQFRYMIESGAGHEPNAVSSIGGWTHCQIALAFALAKKTHSVWSQLTSTEISKIDLIMKAFAIAGHYGYDDGNDYRTDLHCLNDFNKASNPNYQIGYIGVMVAASVYFGASTLDSIFKSFIFSDYMDQFSAFNFINLQNCWNSRPSPGWGPILENGGEDVTQWGTGQGLGVRKSFTFKGIEIDDPFMLYKKVNDWMYGSIVYNSISTWTWSSNVIDGLTINGIAKSWTLEGSSPYLGQPGMGFEFHACDGSGETSPRSNINYVADSWNNDVCIRSFLQETGFWDTANTDSLADIETKMFVGSEDFLYKAAQGFRGYSSRSGKEVVYESDLNVTRGLHYVKEIWKKTMANKVKTSSSKWQSFDVSTKTGNFIVEFDAVPNANNMDGIIGIQDNSTSEYSDQACAIRFYTNGQIEARNGSTFSTSNIRYSFGKRYHFRFTVDFPNRTYCVYVSENGGPEYTLGTDYSFRTEQSMVSQITGWSFINSDTVPGTVRVTNMKFYTESDIISTTAMQLMQD